MRRIVKAFLYYFFNSIVTNIPVYSLRHFYLRKILRIKIGRQTAVHMGCFITGDNIKIGNNSVINRNCYLDGRAGVVIGNNVNVSPEVYILSLTHDVNDPSFKTIAREVVIEDNSWIGVRAIIMPGVNLEKGCVVGAGAVVTKSFPCYSIVAGIPASLKAKRSEELNYQTSYFPYFNTDITKR